MSKLTDNTLLPGKTAQLTASGAIAAGKPVILNTAGTVTQVGETTYTAALGSPAVASAATATYAPNIAYDSANDRVVAIWIDIGNKYGYAKVGTVSGTSITWGTIATWRSIACDEQPAIAFNTSTGQFVIAFTEVTGGSGTNHGWCVVGTVTGTNKNELTFGTAVKSYAGWAPKHRLSYDPDNNKMFLLQKQASNGAYACAATLSGTGTGATISYGTFAQYTNSSNSDAHFGVYYDTSQNCFVIAWNENTGIARTATISGTTVSYGTASTFVSNSAFGGIPATFDTTANKGIIAWVDQSPKIGKLRSITVANTAVSFGSVTTVYSTTSGNDLATASYGLALIYAGNDYNKTILGFQRDAGDDGYYRYAETTLSGTDVATPTGVARLYTANVNNNTTNVCVDSNAKLIWIIKPSQTAGGMTDNYVYGIAQQLPASVTNITATNVIGIADQAIANTASGDISLKGGIATSGVNGLTAGSDYYAQGDGTITTTSTFPAVKLGKAMSSTAINLEYRS
jgi:hypothetical protein